MDKKPTFFNYNGEDVIVQPGRVLTKIELITRLKEMNFLPVDASYYKNHLIDLYDIATTYDNNKIKIFKRLKKDTEYYYGRQKIPRRDIYNDNEDENKNQNNSSLLKRLFFSGVDKNINNNNVGYNNNNENNGDDTFSSSQKSSSFCVKLLKFLYKHKMDVVEIGFYLFLVYSYNSFITNYAQKHYIFGKILLQIRNILTPKRLILGLLLFYIFKYMANLFLSFLFGFGFLTFLYFMFKDKIKDLLLNLLFL